MSLKINSGVLFSSIALAITSSLCCIVPILTIIGGVSGAASSLGWVQPLRPYLIGATVIGLGISFYQAYKPMKIDSCGCVATKKPLLQSKVFLWTITVLSIGLMTFPYYSKVFLPQAKQASPAGISAATAGSFKVSGMSCKSCEDHVNHVLLEQQGVFRAVTSYADSTTTVTYDTSKTSLTVLMRKVTSETGYITTP